MRDINLPGAYLIDWLVIHVLGSGALAERLYDIALSFVSILAMLYLCPRKLRFAGFFAGIMFFLIHARDGPVQMGQRDWSMAVLILVAYCACFRTMRSGISGYYFLTGVLLGCATTVKPIAIIFALPILAEQCVSALRQGRRATIPCLQLASGMAVPSALCVLWLLHERALTAFFSSGVAMMQYHASLQRLPLGLLISRSIAPLLLPLVFGAFLLPFVWQSLCRREAILLCGGVLAGFLCYVIQGKGYAYQRYPFLVFLLLVLGLTFDEALTRKKQWQRWLGILSLCLACIGLAGRAAKKALDYQVKDDEFGQLLRADIEDIGGAHLDGNIQCLDNFSGCIRVLYDLRLHQSTNTLYDEFLFGPSTDRAVESSRVAFVKELATRSPDVFIITPQDYSKGQDTYSKIDEWPLFAKYLSDNYQLCVERTPTVPQLWEGSPRVPLGYRVYVRRPVRCSLRGDAAQGHS